MTELQQGQTPQVNPLKKYYRQPKQYIKPVSYTHLRAHET